MDYLGSKSPSVKNQKGSALILILLVTTILLVIGTAALNVTSNTRESAGLEEKKTQALYNAESGINQNINDIKEKINEFLEEKAINEAAEFTELTYEGDYYDVKVKLVDEEQNQFQAISHGYTTASNGLRVKKSITVRFMPQDEEGQDVIIDPDDSSGGGEQETQLAEVFNYGIFSDDTVELESNVSIDSYPVGGKGKVATNNSIILKSNSSINGDAFFGDDYTCSSNAEIKGEKIQLTSPISVPNDNAVTNLKPSLNYAGGTASEIKSFKNATQTLNNYIFTNSISVQDGTMTFNNCQFNGDMDSSSNVILNNSTVDGTVDISNNSAVTLNNTVINGDLNISSNIALNISGIVWVEGDIELSSNIKTNGNGIIISNSKIKLSSNVDGSQNKRTNVALISLYVSNPNNEKDSAIEMSSNTKLHGVIFAPRGFVKLDSNSEVYGSVVGKKVQLNSNAKVLFDESIPNTPLPLPGSTIVDTGGGTPHVPVIAGIKVIDWKEN